jgi:hypothetical protein
MAKWARIIDGVIAEIVTADPATLFTAPIAALFEPVDDSAVYRAVWDDQAEEWTPPPPPDPQPEPGPPDMAPVRAAAHVEIDAAAGAARASVLTMVPGQEMTYLRKEDQARAYLADGDPDDADYPLLQASVGADAYPTGHPNAGQLVATVAEAAAVVMMVSEAWTNLGAVIERVRLRGKRLVTLAEDQAEVDAIRAWCQAAYAAALAGESLPAEPGAE